MAVLKNLAGVGIVVVAVCAALSWAGSPEIRRPIPVSAPSPAVTVEPEAAATAGNSREELPVLANESAEATEFPPGDPINQGVAIYTSNVSTCRQESSLISVCDRPKRYVKPSSDLYGYVRYLDSTMRGLGQDYAVQICGLGMGGTISMYELEVSTPELQSVWYGFSQPERELVDSHFRYVIQQAKDQITGPDSQMTSAKCRVIARQRLGF